MTMDLEVTLPPTVQSISPVMIAAPTSHAGTAMIQRLMCTSENALCYGDNVFEELLSVIEWATSLIDAHQHRRDKADASLQAALDRKPLKWMPDAAPSFDIHMSSIFSTVYNIPHTAQDFAAEHGFDVWGMIRSDMPAALLIDLLSVFPAGKGILIYRNPFDSARDLLQDDPVADLGAHCDAWAFGMDGYLRVTHDRLVKLRYEDAIGDPEGFAKALGDASGASGIDPAGIAAGCEAETPSERALTDGERDMITARCADMLTVYYPDMV